MRGNEATMQRPVRLLVGVPSIGLVHVEFLDSLCELIRELNEDGVRFDVFTIKRTVIHMARELIAERAILGRYTHVLWLDSDMTFDGDIWRGLIYTMNDTGADLVSGIYRSRHGHRGLCLWESIKPVVQMEALPDEEVFDIAGCGFGIVLTTTRILDLVRNHSLLAFAPMAEYGEDLSFCYRAAQLGAKLVATQAVQAGHLSTARIDVNGDMTAL